MVSAAGALLAGRQSPALRPTEGGLVIGAVSAVGIIMVALSGLRHIDSAVIDVCLLLRLRICLGALLCLSSRCAGRRRHYNRSGTRTFLALRARRSHFRCVLGFLGGRGRLGLFLAFLGLLSGLNPLLAPLSFRRAHLRALLRPPLQSQTAPSCPSSLPAEWRPHLFGLHYRCCKHFPRPPAK